MILNKFEKDKILEWHNLVIQGLTNGLTHTIWDGRREDPEWVRKRLTLWETYARCLDALINDTTFEDEEKELIEIVKEGYKKDEK